MVRLNATKMSYEIKEDDEIVSTVGLTGEASGIKFNLTMKGGKDIIDTVTKGYGIRSYNSPVELILKKVQSGLDDFTEKPKVTQQEQPDEEDYENDEN